MKRHLLTAIAIVTGVALAPHAAAAQTAINVSYQPAVYWALPFYVATEKGFWKEGGLAPQFSVFPAGAPQVAAAQAKSWDVGGTGSVPAVLGAARSGLSMIGISNDESKGNALMASASRYDSVKADPKSMKGQKILLTTNSTGDYAVRSCLKKYGLSNSDLQFVNLGQAQIISAISSNNGDLVGVWAPNIYTLEEKVGAKIVCSGADAGATIPGTLVVRTEYAQEHPDLVAKVLAVYLRAWGWIEKNPKEARALMKKFYADGGVEISAKAIDEEFETRPIFLLDDQLRILNRSKGASEVDDWMGKIGTFMTEVGTLSRAPATKDFITDKYMKMVSEDPKLKAFATEFGAKTH
jgi:NitT/TauT family transport system substrate-binding protein